MTNSTTSGTTVKVTLPCKFCKAQVQYVYLTHLGQVCEACAPAGDIRGASS